MISSVKNKNHIIGNLDDYIFSPLFSITDRVITQKCWEQVSASDSKGALRFRGADD